MHKTMMIMLLIGASGTAWAQEFSKASQCVAGVRVVDREGNKGEIVELNNGMCKVRKDADGETRFYMHWYLRPVGASAQTSDKLSKGLYACYTLAGGMTNYAFIDIRIDSADSYRDKRGKSGKYRLTDSGKIIFESGSLAAANGKLMAGPRIGLNMDGGSFYNITCSPKK
ncbi:MAG: hypothetical protein V4688_02805 [Pseudomonadota bacterium]